MEKKFPKVLVTAGATMVMVDKVRGITNVFKGRTGTEIAEWLFWKGWDVTLITSNPDLTKEVFDRITEVYDCPFGRLPFEVKKYRTFDELEAMLKEELSTTKYDLIVHSAAVSDYRVARVMVPDGQGGFTPIDASAKVASNHPEIRFDLVPTIKLIDQFRNWGFSGMLVKFKLQVEISDEDLLEIARRSLHESSADLIVANCHEWARERAYVVRPDGTFKNVSRDKIAAEIDAAYKGRVK